MKKSRNYCITGTVTLTPVETGQTEAVGVGGEEKSPGGSDSSRRKMVGQEGDELLR